MHRLLTQPRFLGLVCAACAVGLGDMYLVFAGAPPRYPLINLGALTLGSVLWLALGDRPAVRWTGVAVLGLAALLLTTAVAGTHVNGASRWVTIGPLSLQVSFLVLPALIVLYARTTDAIGTAGVVVAAAALAAQPDRAMAAMLAAGAGVIAMARPNRSSVIAAVGAGIAFVVTLCRPDTLPAEPFVERVLYSAFDVHLLVGAAVIVGCLILVAPAFPAVRRVGERPVLLAFGASWATAIAAAAIGNYPTPLVGYGGAAVLGYLFSAALLPGERTLARARG